MVEEREPEIKEEKRRGRVGGPPEGANSVRGACASEAGEEWWKLGLPARSPSAAADPQAWS